MLGRARQQGDTLVEVLFAFAVFSLVAVGALTIMNQGAAMAERSLETSIVTQTLNDQAETLRFLHDSYVASYVPGETYNPNAPVKDAAWQWQALMHYVTQAGVTSVSQLGGTMTACPTLPAQGGFIVNTQTGQFVSAPTFTAPTTYAKVQGSSSQGIWIQAIQSTNNSGDPYQSNLGYVDFHIQACWPAPNGVVPASLSTIVRLYEPR